MLFIVITEASTKLAETSAKLAETSAETSAETCAETCAETSTETSASWSGFLDTAEVKLSLFYIRPSAWMNDDIRYFEHNLC